MGSKWLKQGGATPGRTTAETGGDMVDTEMTDRGKVGIGIDSNLQKETQLQEAVGDIVSNQNQYIKCLLPNIQDNLEGITDNATEADPTEITVLDLKRRRPNPTVSLDSDMVTDPQNKEETNQKHLLMAGSAVQARLSL